MVKNKRMSTLLELPYEIWLKIFSYVDWLSKSRAKQVSRGFRDLAEASMTKSSSKPMYIGQGIEGNVMWDIYVSNGMNKELVKQGLRAVNIYRLRYRWLDCPQVDHGIHSLDLRNEPMSEEDCSCCGDTRWFEPCIAVALWRRGDDNLYIHVVQHLIYRQQIHEAYALAIFRSDLPRLVEYTKHVKKKGWLDSIPKPPGLVKFLRPRRLRVHTIEILPS